MAAMGIMAIEVSSGNWLMQKWYTMQQEYLWAWRWMDGWMNGWMDASSGWMPADGLSSVGCSFPGLDPPTVTRS